MGVCSRRVGEGLQVGNDKFVVRSLEPLCLTIEIPGRTLTVAQGDRRGRLLFHWNGPGEDVRRFGEPLTRPLDTAENA